MNRFLRSAVALALALVLAVLGTSALELSPRGPNAPSTWCCCAETGVDARCSCVGDCCQHEPVPTLCSTARAAKPTPGMICVSNRCRRAPSHTGAAPVLDPFLAVTHRCVLHDFVHSQRFAPVALAAADRATPSPERPPNSARA